MNQKQKASVAETAIRSDSVAEVTQQIEEGTPVKGNPCSRCSSCLKCKLASGQEPVHSVEADAHAKPVA